MGGGASKANKKLVVLGLDNAGKTSVVQTLLGASPFAVSPTRGFNSKEITIDRSKFVVLDVGGQKSERTYWRDHFKRAVGIIWVIDSSDRRRMYETGLELATILQDEWLHGVPILILANKQDLSTAAAADEITVELELHAIRNHNWHIQDCSAVENRGIREGLDWLIGNINLNAK